MLRRPHLDRILMGPIVPFDGSNRNSVLVYPYAHDECSANLGTSKEVLRVGTKTYFQ